MGVGKPVLSPLVLPPRINIEDLGFSWISGILSLGSFNLYWKEAVSSVRIRYNLQKFVVKTRCACALHLCMRGARDRDK